ncbi:hypothetical protein [Desulfospira joergensenii]|uniref:hypothetical protein n=1 Tax=Desulfospira joergensenii TaxID=53329 RepID=UPI0003B73830|nr:hypothetical protein [Desulfospira joergensenii]
MELLILKTGKEYIRVKPDGFHCVGLDKASVFPMDKMDQVRAHETELKQQGFPGVRLKKLVLSEKDVD